MTKRLDLLFITLFIALISTAAIALATPQSPALTGTWVSENTQIEFNEHNFVILPNDNTHTSDKEQGKYTVANDHTLKLSYSILPGIYSMPAELSYTVEDNVLTLNGFTYTRVN